MKYFTQILYSSTQLPDGLTEAEEDRFEQEADKRWRDVDERYQNHLASIIDDLPPDARKLTNHELHDARLKDVVLSDKESLLLRFDTSNVAGRAQ